MGFLYCPWTPCFSERCLIYFFSKWLWVQAIGVCKEFILFLPLFCIQLHLNAFAIRLFSSLITLGSFVTDHSLNHVSWQENKQVLSPLKNDSLLSLYHKFRITCILCYFFSILVTWEDARLCGVTFLFRGCPRLKA